MLQDHRIAVVIPAYNEEHLLTRTLESVPDFVDDIIVVDDASTDRTAQICNEFVPGRVILLQHLKNGGVGAAILTGYAGSLARKADIAVVMAADAQMSPLDLPALLAPVLAGDADYSKGMRLCWGGGPKNYAVLPVFR
ncbi:glycosyltransferase family 2 protein [Planctomycetota bacterium]